MLLANNGENVVFFKNEIFFAFQLELGAAILGVQDAVALADVHRGAIAVIKQAARADRDDGAFLGLLFGCIRDNNAALGYFFFRGGFDDYTVANWTNVCHDSYSFL